MTAAGFLVTLASAVTTMLANLLLRWGVLHSGGFTFTPQSALRLLADPRFSGGVVLYGLAAVLWFRVLSIENLSTAYPVLVGITFFLVTAGAVWAFGEPLSARKVAGLVVILLGVILVARSG